ncbi:MAG: Hsp70 family protein [Chloroflexi bacterium]|nr:Hsp70 family protein [Chloroflexota bacterium]MCL5274243.1 Hsp70 family protein [Chloroflexota bacterium]
MQLGIDFGTTNTVAAIIGPDGAPTVLPLDPDGSGQNTLRTLLYVERDGMIHTGGAAVRLHRSQNVGRLPRFARAWVGVIDIEIGDAVVKGYNIPGGAMSVEVFADVDADAPGRLLHSLKGPLATAYAGTKLFDREYTLEELIAEFLKRVRARVEDLTGRVAQEAVFGRPVNFAGARVEADNCRAQTRLQHAAELAGFTRVAFEQEPIAAGLAFGAQRRMAAGSHALVFDFGGGTLDIAVLRVESGGEQRVLATGGVGIAGDHFDQSIFRRAMLPWLGEGVLWGPQKLALPAHLLDALGDWQDVVALCNAPTLGFLRQVQADCSQPIRIYALEDFVFKGYAFDLYERVEQCKVALSTQRFDVIGFDEEAISIWQPITRRQFESFIARDGRTIRDTTLQTLESAGLRVDQIDFVIRTGGSSSIPYFIDMLAEMFGREKVVESDLFTSVASGLAVRAAQL